MAVSGQAEVGRVDLMRRGDADGIGPHEEAVLVVLERGRVEIVVKARLHGVTRPENVLLVIVGDEDLLLPRVKRVEEAIGVFLTLVEQDQVELVAVCQPRAEQPDGGCSSR